SRLSSSLGSQRLPGSRAGGSGWTEQEINAYYGAARARAAAFSVSYSAGKIAGADVRTAVNYVAGVSVSVFGSIGLAQSVRFAPFALRSKGAISHSHGLLEALGSRGALLGRHKYGLLNRNDYLRFGWNWSGPAVGGREALRIAIGSKRVNWLPRGHINLWPWF
ncbi:MAG: hypothetical protein AB3N28_12055, partial [Kordiimonas sp.]